MNSHVTQDMPLVVMDETGVVTSTSEAWRTLSIQSDSVAASVRLGTSFRTIVDKLVGHCPSLANELLQKISQTLEGGLQAFILEYPNVSDAGLSWYFITGQAFLDGDKRCIRLSVKDVSELRQSDVTARILNKSLDANLSGIVIVDAVLDSLPIIYANAAFEKITGYSVQESVGRNCRFLQGLNSLQPGLVGLRAGLKSKIMTTSLLQNYRKDGSMFLNEVSIFPVANEAGQVVYFVGIQRDLTTEKIAKSALQAVRERERIGLRFANVGVFELNPGTGEIDSQDYAREMLGLEPDTVLTLEVLKGCISPDDRPRFEESMRSCLGGISGIDLEYQVVWPDGTVKWLHTKGHVFEQRDGVGLRLVCMSQDVTQRRIVDRHIRYVAEHDALTGLPNRAVMRDRCEQVLSVAQRNQTCVGLLFIDLDDFKQVNDTHGHQIGDELLKQVAHRLRGAVRAADTVCRQSGDEFVVILQDLPNGTAIEYCVRKIHETLSQPYEIGGVTFSSTASIGISCAPADGTSTEELVRHADMAMYASKRKGGGCYEYYSQAIGRTIHEIQNLRSELSTAIAQNQLTLFFQPQINAATGKMVGLEALLRWRHPTKGLLTPAQFMPVAQSSGDLLFLLEEWVIYEVMKQRLAWIKDGQFLNVPVYINISASYFSDRHLVSKISAHLRSVNFGPMNIGFEIPEAAIWGEGCDPNVGVATVRELDGLGVFLAIDNYGAGLSSINQLAKCPVDSIKIDKSSMQKLTEDRVALAALGALSAMGKSLHLQVVAQAVESKQQARVASRLGCNTLQGNLICSPVNAIELAKYTNNTSSTTALAF
jgi:diguanylate cyclase (GGDEF)-like protein/PAS domain S-box-containing protein